MLVDQDEALFGQLQAQVRLDVLDTDSGKALPRT
jgi:hypothetical protein